MNNEKMDNYIYLGQRIREKRKTQNITQEYLAEQVDVGTTHISHIETGYTKLSLKTFIKIANALNCSADELLCDYVNVSSKVYKNELCILLENCSEKEIRFVFNIVKSSLDLLHKCNFN